MSSAWLQGGVAELIVGITRDPLFGPVMTVGSGGVLVELLKDSATLLLPATPEDIEAALRGLKLFPLLDGFRGRPKADLDAAIDADRWRFPIFALANADTIGANSTSTRSIVCAEGKGAWVADALLVRSEGGIDDRRHHHPPRRRASSKSRSTGRRPTPSTSRPRG